MFPLTPLTKYRTKSTKLSHGWTKMTFLSVEKYVVLHCGLRQPNNVYHIRDFIIKIVDNLSDLSISRSSNCSFSDHYLAIANMACRICSLIGYTFRSKHQNLLWPAFLYYVLPILTYCSQVWNPFLLRDIELLERIQRSFTKRMRVLECMTNYERINSLGAYTLTNKISFADMTTVCKFLHRHINFTASDAGIVTVSSVTRSDGLRLKQLRPINLSCANCFSIRSASMWNKLRSYIVNYSSLAPFKRNLLSYFYSQQS